MSQEVFAVCLISILCLQVRSQVCTRTITTFESSFIASHCEYPTCYYGLQNIRNVTTKEPVVKQIPSCCGGFCIVNPRIEPTSTNCVRICKGNCTTVACWTENKCFPAEKYLEERKHYACQTIPLTVKEDTPTVNEDTPTVTEDTPTVKENTQTVKEDTELKNKTTDSVTNTTCLYNCSHNMYTKNFTLPNNETACGNVTCYVSNLCTNESLSATRESLLSGCLWASVIMNIILFVIIIVITKRNPGICSKKSDVANKKNTTESNNRHYEDIREVGVPDYIKNRPPLIREESDNGSIPDEPLQYDYVQVPLPINKRNIQQVPPRSQFRL